MLYNKILNPKTGNLVSVTSSVGKQVLNGYIKQLQGGRRRGSKRRPNKTVYGDAFSGMFDTPDGVRMSDSQVRTKQGKKRGPKARPGCKVNNESGRCVHTTPGRMDKRCVYNKSSGFCKKK